MNNNNLVAEIEKQEQLAERPEMFKAFMYVYSSIDSKEVFSVDGKKYEKDSLFKLL